MAGWDESDFARAQAVLKNPEVPAEAKERLAARVREEWEARTPPTQAEISASADPFPGVPRATVGEPAVAAAGWDDSKYAGPSPQDIARRGRLSLGNIGATYRTMSADRAKRIEALGLPPPMTDAEAASIATSAIPGLNLVKNPLGNAAINVGVDAATAGATDYLENRDMSSALAAAKRGAMLSGGFRTAGALATGLGKGWRAWGKGQQAAGEGVAKTGEALASGGRALQQAPAAADRAAAAIEGSVPAVRDVLNRAGQAAEQGGAALASVGRAGQDIAPVVQRGGEMLSSAGGAARKVDISPEVAQVKQAVGEKFESLTDPAALEKGAKEYTAAAAGVRMSSPRKNIEAAFGSTEEFGGELKRLGIGTGTPSGKAASRLPQSVETYIGDAEAIMDRAGKERGRYIKLVTKKAPVDKMTLADAFAAEAEVAHKQLGQSNLAGQLATEAGGLKEREAELTAEELWDSIKANRKSAIAARKRGDEHSEAMAEIRDRLWNDALDGHIKSHTSKDGKTFRKWKQAGRDYRAAVNAQKVGEDIRTRGVSNRTFSLTDYVAASSGGLMGAAAAVGNRLVRDFEKDAQARLYGYLAEKAQAGQYPQAAIDKARGIAERGVEHLGKAPQYAGAALETAGHVATVGAKGLGAAGQATEIAGQGISAMGRGAQRAAAGSAVDRAAGAVADVTRMGGAVTGSVGHVAELAGKAAGAAGRGYAKVGRANQAIGGGIGTAGSMATETGRVAGRNPQLMAMLGEREETKRQGAWANNVRRAVAKLGASTPRGTEELVRAVQAGENTAYLKTVLEELKSENPEAYRQIIGGSP